MNEGLCYSNNLANWSQASSREKCKKTKQKNNTTSALFVFGPFIIMSPDAISGLNPSSFVTLTGFNGTTHNI